MKAGCFGWHKGLSDSIKSVVVVMPCSWVSCRMMGRKSPTAGSAGLGKAATGWTFGGEVLSDFVNHYSLLLKTVFLMF